MCFFVNNDKITQKRQSVFVFIFWRTRESPAQAAYPPKAARALIVGECVILIVCVVGFCVILSLLRKKGYHPQSPAVVAFAGGVVFLATAKIFFLCCLFALSVFVL